MQKQKQRLYHQDIRCNMAWLNSLKEDLLVELCRRKPPHIDNHIWRWMIYLQVLLCCSDKTSNLKTLWWVFVTIFWHFNRQKKWIEENIQQINQCNFSRFENNICSPIWHTQYHIGCLAAGLQSLLATAVKNYAALYILICWHHPLWLNSCLSHKFSMVTIIPP